MNEADEEHHVARVLIAELDRDGRGDDHQHAKFTVLAESVRHHIKEEEGEMMPKAKGVEMDYEALGEQMLARKRELQKHGIPEDAEHKMVASMNGRCDSPAARARRSKPAGSSTPRNGKSPTRVGIIASRRPTKRRSKAAAGRKTSRSR